VPDEKSVAFAVDPLSSGEAKLVRRVVRKRHAM
jgi:hypothetical protein